MSRPWHEKEWREKREEFLQNKLCALCGATENLVIHHVDYLNDEGNLISDEEYRDFSSDKVQVLCSKCHFKYHDRGYVLCKKCKKNFHQPQYETCKECATISTKGKVLCKICKENYHEPRFETCFRCISIEYKHPWCGRKYRVHKDYELMISSPEMCCYSLCNKDTDECKLFKENSDVFGDQLI